MVNGFYFLLTRDIPAKICCGMPERPQSDMARKKVLPHFFLADPPLFTGHLLLEIFSTLLVSWKTAWNHRESENNILVYLQLSILAVSVECRNFEK